MNYVGADMISDNEPLLTRFISVPKDFSQLNCGAFIAGVIESMLEGSQFVSATATSPSLACQYNATNIACHCDCAQHLSSWPSAAHHDSYQISYNRHGTRKDTNGRSLDN